MTSRLRDLVAGIKAHWPVLVVAPAMLLVFTVLHEAAHAAAVRLQGGTITDFVVVPGQGLWGYVTYTFPPGAAYSDFAIAVAPYVLWMTLIAIAVAVSLRPRRLPTWAAGMVFVWMYVAPMADIMNAWLPWLRGETNDFHAAFGAADTWDGWIAAAGLALWAGVGFGVQRRLYGLRALSVRGCTAASALLFLVAAAYFLLV